MSSSISFPEGSSLLTLGISVWTAKARLTREDLSPEAAAALPPEALTSLGTKRLIDPALLKPINGLKAAAFRLMASAGVRFLGGWMLSEESLAETTAKLDEMAAEFSSIVDEFCDCYDAEARSWASQFPEWEHIILEALPSAEELRTKRFRFVYQVFNVVPNTDYIDRPANSIAAETNALPETAYQDMAAAISSYVDQAFSDGRTKFSDRTLNGLLDLAKRAHNGAFLCAPLENLAELLESLHSTYLGRGNDTAAIATLRSTLRLLTDPAVARQVSADYVNRTVSSSSDWFAALASPTPTPIPIPTPADTPAPAPEDALTVDDMLRVAQDYLAAQPTSTPPTVAAPAATPTAAPASAPAPAPAATPPAAPAAPAASLLEDWGLI